MKIVALAAGLSFLVVGTLVGLRMLRLARRTRSLPELLLGGGLTSLTVVTLPAVALSLGVRVGSEFFQTALYALALVPVVGFAMCLHAFTARVFRPDHRWASVCTGLAGAACAIGAAGNVLARSAALGVDGVVGPYWAALIVAPFITGMAWTGVESLLCHMRLRRRLVLGLADPVVCDRFRLWAIGNLAAVVGVGVVGVSLFLGWRVVNHPVPMLGLALAGLLLSGSWYLAFLPPRAYLERIRAHASADAPAV